MDIEKIKELLKLVEDSGIAEIEISEGEESVRIARVPPNAAHLAAVPPAPVAAPVAEEPAGGARDEGPDAELPDGHVIAAPMVGTFYTSATPESQPFVAIGTEVSEGATLCIIEAMKVMNQIDADRAGKISAVLVDNGQPVEYGQPLFVIS